MGSWYYYNRYLPNMWKRMVTEIRREDESYWRSKARREGRAYKSPDVRRADREWKRKREKIHEFAREYREFEEDPQGYIDRHGPGEHTTVMRLEDDGPRDITGTWVPFEGPRGGQGWKHTGTGAKRYQHEKPGSNSRLQEPPDIERLWRDPPELSSDDPDFEAPLSAGEAREYFERGD